MKEDLVITLELTSDKGEEVSLRKDLAGNILFALGGAKFSLSPSELLDAMKKLDKFYKGKKFLEVSSTKTVAEQAFDPHATSFSEDDDQPLTYRT